MCNHDWQPILGWYARYRCSKCDVIGCKFGVVALDPTRSMAIQPYRCGERRDGVKCRKPAVMKVRGEGPQCAACLSRKRAAQKRQDRAAAKRRKADFDNLLSYRLT